MRHGKASKQETGQFLHVSGSASTAERRPVDGWIPLGIVTTSLSRTCLSTLDRENGAKGGDDGCVADACRCADQVQCRLNAQTHPPLVSIYRDDLKLHTYN